MAMPYSISTILLLSSLFTVPSLARNLARLAPQQRASYQGGWALSLPGQQCPADASVSCGTNDGTVNPTCCPSGQTCYGLTTPHCCPTDTGSDCESAVNNFPVCANSTWDMYVLSGSGAYFCCEPGQIGVLPISGYAGLCEPSDQVVASSLIASPAGYPGGPAVPTAPGAAQTGGAGQTTTTATGAAAKHTTTTNTASGSKETGTGLNLDSDIKKAILSSAAIAGIAAGGAVLIAIVLCIFCLCCRRRRRNNKKQEYVSTAAAGYGYGGEGRQAAEPQYTAVPAPYEPVQEYKSNVVVGPEQGGYGGQGWTGRAEL